MKQKKLLLFTFLWILFGNLVYRYLWNDQIVLLIPDFIVCSLAIAKSKKITFDLVKPIFSKWFRLSIYAFVLVGIFSDIIHMMSPSVMLWGLRMFIRYFLLLLLVVKYINIDYVEKIYKWIYKAYIINLIFCVIQLMTGETGDSMGGIFGGNGDLALFIVTTAIIFTFDYFRNRISFLKLLLIIILDYAMALWAEIKMMYFVIPIVFYASYVIAKKFTITNLIILIIGAISAGPVLQIVLSTYYDEDYVSQTLDAEKLDEYNNDSYGFTEESVNRGNCIDVVSKYIIPHKLERGIGYGIGSGTKSQFFKSEIAEKYKRTFYNYFTMSYVLVEVGWCGLVLIFVIYTLITCGFLRLYYKEDDTKVKYWSGFGFLIGLFTYLFIYYDHSPYTSYYYPFFIWGVCYVAIRERQKELGYSQAI